MALHTQSIMQASSIHRLSTRRSVPGTPMCIVYRSGSPHVADHLPICLGLGPFGRHQDSRHGLATDSVESQSNLILPSLFAHDHFLLRAALSSSLISSFFSIVTPSRIQHCLCRPELPCTQHSSRPSTLISHHHFHCERSHLPDIGGSDKGLRTSTRHHCRSFSDIPTNCGNTPHATQWLPICHLSAV